MAKQMTRLAAIKEYFGIPERPVNLKELKALSSGDRVELAEGAAKELGATIVVKQ